MGNTAVKLKTTKKSAKSTYGKKTARRARTRARTVRNRNTVPVGLGFPKKMVITHKYCENLLFQTGALGVKANYNYSCNGMYDPNATGVGHQPMYFDQMIALYDHYCVIGSKITVKVCKGNDGYPQVPITVGMFVNDDTTTSTSTQTLMENSLGIHKVISTGQPFCTLTKKWSARKYFGKSPLANTDLQGDLGNNPTEQSFYTIWIDSSASVLQTDCILDVTIEYIAVWKELKDIAGS